MFNLAERFVEDWIEENVKKAQILEKDLGLVERLALKLENDAWEFGLLRKAYLEAVNGDSHELLWSEVWRASDETSQCEEAPRMKTRFQSGMRGSGAGNNRARSSADAISGASEPAQGPRNCVCVISLSRMKPLGE